MNEITLHIADHETAEQLNPQQVAAERRAARKQMYLIKGTYYASQSGNGTREKLRRLKQLAREVKHATA